jgi:hypothetical protein
MHNLNDDDGGEVLTDEDVRQRTFRGMSARAIYVSLGNYLSPPKKQKVSNLRTPGPQKLANAMRGDLVTSNVKQNLLLTPTAEALNELMSKIKELPDQTIRDYLDDLLSLKAGDFDKFVGVCLHQLQKNFHFNEIQIKSLYRCLMQRNSWSKENSENLAKTLMIFFSRKDRDLSNFQRLTFDHRFQDFNQLFLDPYGNPSSSPWTFTSNGTNNTKFFLGHEGALGNKLITRYQTVGLCSLIAVVVFVEYDLFGLQGHLNIADCLFHTSDYYSDFMRLAQGTGTADPRTFLSKLANVSDQQIVRHTSWNIPQLCRLLVNYLATRPILLTEFKVYDHFRNEYSQQASFDIFPMTPGKFWGRHCMVIIGARVVVTHGNEKFFFLVQNWWKYRTFVEISAEYLQCCDAAAVILQTPITWTNPQGVTYNDFDLAETVDGASTSEEERISAFQIMIEAEFEDSLEKNAHDETVNLWPPTPGQNQSSNSGFLAELAQE